MIWYTAVVPKFPASVDLRADADRNVAVRKTAVDADATLAVLRSTRLNPLYYLRLSIEKQLL